MAAPHQGPDRTTEEIPVEPDNMKKQSLPTRDEGSVSPPSPVDAADLGTSMVTANQSRSGSFGAANDHSIYPSNVYSPQAQAFYHEGFDNATGKRDDYPQFVNGEGLEIRPPGMYNDNHPVVFHTGYGYNPQMPYGPYSPVTPPLPPVGGDSQLYPPQQFSYSGTPYYQQLVSHSSPYINSSAPVSQPELLPLVSPDQQNDGVHFGPRPNYQPPLGSVSRGNFPGNSGTHDLQQGFDGFRSGGLWSDWSKPADRQRSFTPLSPTISPQLVGALGSFGNIGTASQQQRSLYGFGSGSNSYNRGYRGGSNWGSSFGSASFSNTGINGRGWLALDNSIRHGRGSSSLCSCNPMLDVLSEQNRGPRSSKPKNQNTTESNPQVENNKDGKSTVKSPDGLYNQVDFDTEYDDAKFFVIKSYSEDNVHKSIKYGVWASTPNGNRKLDAAYNEAKEKQGSCPIFFLFSVNASAHFCGVAEMVGPVDFDKSVDYWQQDKWSGQFPVKWHIIKDVPNSQFRHIILENNDNKPVTNSRDTQEVKLEQGTEMLKIFKNYETDLSILDDFNFYEERQKAIQEHKARHQSGLVGAGVVGGKEQEIAVLSNDVMKQMSKTFAQVVLLDDSGSKEGLATDRNGSPSDSPPKAN